MKLAIFDLDGTLTDSLEDIALATNYALSELGLKTYPLNAFNYFIGDGLVKLIQRALPSDHQDKVNDALQLYNNYYSKNYTVKTKIYDGINELLIRLYNDGIKLAVASNKTHEFTVNIINHYFRKDLFSVVLGKSDERGVKPDPEIIFEILNLLNISKHQTVMIGDTDIDIKTAKNAGIHSAGCLWGFRTKDELIKAGAEFIAEHPSDLEKYIVSTNSTSQA